MIRFTRLKLHGFKSFVDNTELSIEAGMTGIVGPNGCGKSNLVEALRWVMGEASARLMRGSEMDDVIFGGTAHRPPRSLAEVSLFLDNEQRTAPAAFNDHPEIEVTRRIERGFGSIYRCNGREVRARDVQILFADSSSGARSTAMVNQGKVGELIGAKPTQRRALLEEAAGIAGLHARRQEAETRLKGAESNLERLGDVITGLEAQLTNLRRQAKQAERYRILSAGIREIEATVLYLRWAMAVDALDAAKKVLVEKETLVSQATRVVTEASTEQVNAALELPALRAAELEAANAVNALRMAIEQNQAEERRLATAREQAERRVQQLAADVEREQSRVSDAEAALARLAGEDDALKAASHDEEAHIAAASAAVATATHASEQAEHHLAEVTARLAAERSAEQAAAHRLSESQERVRRLEVRQRDGAVALAEAQRLASHGRSLSEAEGALSALEAQLAQARTTMTAAESNESGARQARHVALEAVQQAAALPARLQAEADALRAVLVSPAKAGTAPPILDGLKVVAGYEKALAAALGDDLSLPADPAAAAFWQPHTAPATQTEADVLAAYVSGETAGILARRLASVRLVVDRGEGDRLQTSLTIGQRLVSRQGDLWRWDGLVRRAGATSATAARLEQRNRLAVLENELVPAREALAVAQAAAGTAKTAAEQAERAVQAARQDARSLEAHVSKARATVAEVARETAVAQNRIAALVAQAETQAAELAEAQQVLVEATSAHAALHAQRSDPSEQDRCRLAVAEARAALAEVRARHGSLTRDAAERQSRRQRLAHDVAEWRQRLTAVLAGQGDLAQRRAEAFEHLQQLVDQPTVLSQQRQTLLDQLTEAEGVRQKAADTLAMGEARATAADRSLRDVERQLATCREERVRAEASVQQGEEASRQQAVVIAERLDCTPLQAKQAAGLADDAVLPTLAEGEARLAKLSRDREAVGPVNLRAEQEAAEIAEQHTTMLAERDDLVAAIARLRQGINELNREGRQRLTASFERVDTEFRRLFVRLFGGGKAHLALVENDDPLQAGLEIYASPPGKRLQVLSLLSGGEQAMTALALLFAVFLVNPAPVCVLDEVDAPLDDANVDRFCTLLSEISQASGQATRFLVVTHHRMTMSRMDRLYGVTMAERGVSKLVSVDLRQADAFIERD